MANNGIYYSSAHTLNFTTTGTTWATLTSGGTFQMNAVSATTYYNLPYSGTVVGTGTTNYITKWTNTTGLTDSQIVDDGNQVYIGAGLTHATSKFGVAAPIEFQGIQMTQINGSVAITDSDLGGWSTGGGEIAIGTGNPLAGSTGSGNIAIGYQTLQTNSTGINNTAVGQRVLISNQSGQGNTALGYRAGQNIDSGSYNVLIGYEAGSNLTTEDNRLYIANNTYGTLIYGDFVSSRVGINTTNPLAPLDVSGNTVIQGTLSATTYLNYPGSSSANCISELFVTKITGCSPVSIVSPLRLEDGLSVTGTSTFTSQANFTGGLSANTFSASTYQNLPTDVFVSAGTYSNGQITFTNTTGGTFNVSNIPIGGAGGQPYYLNLSVSQTPYQEFAPSATTAAEQTTGVTIASGVTTTIANFLTPTGYPNATLIPAGIWSFYLHSYKANSSTTFNIFVEVYKRTTGGTETLLVSTDPTDVNSIGVASMEISDTYYSGSSLNVSDRILIKVRATNTGTASSTITFLTEGTDHYSYGVTPFTNTGNVLGVTATDGISGSSTTGSITLINTDKGSSQNIFKNIQVAGVTQFSAGSNSSNLNFSGINITITSAATNTLVFSAGTGGVSGNFLPTSGGTITGNLIVTGDTNISGTTTSTGNVISLQNLQSLFSSGDEGGEITLAKPATNSTISGTSVTIDIYQNKLRFFESGSPNRGAYIDLTQGLPSAGSNLLSGGTGGGVTQIVAGTNITISPTGGTGTVTINSTGGGLGTVYTTANNFNFL